jgi:hypothetical protein
MSDHYTEHLYGNEQLASELDQSAPQVDWRNQRESTRLHAYETMKDIVKRMDLLIQELPYSKNHHFLQLRATASHFIADLLAPEAGGQQKNTKEILAARRSEQEVASNMLQKIVDAGGHIAIPFMGTTEQDSDSREESPHELYVSLPIRST